MQKDIVLMLVLVLKEVRNLGEVGLVLRDLALMLRDCLAACDGAERCCTAALF